MHAVSGNTDVLWLTHRHCRPTLTWTHLETRLTSHSAVVPANVNTPTVYFLQKNLQLKQKTKARFSRLLWHPAREWRGPILVLALHKSVSVTYLLRHLPTQYSPGTHKGPTLHRTDLIIFPVTLQTIIVAQMMSSQKRNSEDKRNRFLQAVMPFCHQINSVKALTLTTRKWHLTLPCYWLQSEGTPHTVHQLYDAPLRLSYKQQQQQSMKNHFPSLIRVQYICFCLQCFCLQCFDAVGWAAGRASSPHWRGHLSGARCKWFAYGPADATAALLSLAPVKSRMVYLSGAG